MGFIRRFESALQNKMQATGIKRRYPHHTRHLLKRNKRARNLQEKLRRHGISPAQRAEVRRLLDAYKRNPYCCPEIKKEHQDLFDITGYEFEWEAHHGPETAKAYHQKANPTAADREDRKEYLQNNHRRLWWHKVVEVRKKGKGKSKELVARAEEPEKAKEAEKSKETKEREELSWHVRKARDDMMVGGFIEICVWGISKITGERRIVRRVYIALKYDAYQGHGFSSIEEPEPTTFNPPDDAYRGHGFKAIEESEPTTFGSPDPPQWTQFELIRFAFLEDEHGTSASQLCGIAKLWLAKLLADRERSKRTAEEAFGSEEQESTRATTVSETPNPLPTLPKLPPVLPNADSTPQQHANLLMLQAGCSGRQVDYEMLHLPPARQGVDDPYQKVRAYLHELHALQNTTVPVQSTNNASEAQPVAQEMAVVKYVIRHNVQMPASVWVEPTDVNKITRPKKARPSPKWKTVPAKKIVNEILPPEDFGKGKRTKKTKQFFDQDGP